MDNNVENTVENTVESTSYSSVNAGENVSKTDEEVKILVKKAHRKGILQGFLISFGILLLASFVYLGVSIVSMINDGSVYARLAGSYGSTILDRKTIEKINSIYKIMENTFIEEVDKEVVREGIYRGMLESLDDPYSVYYTKEEYEEMMESSTGVFEGIGAYLSQDPDTRIIKVVRPIKDSPAERAGLLAEDIIVEVDGEDVTDQDLNLVVSKVRGPKGSTVNIGILRANEAEILYFDIERDKVNEQSVEYEMFDNDIGYIYIMSFEDATDDQFNDAYDELTEQGMKSLIIDLRSNGGGYVDTSVNIADRLVKEGKIVSIKDRRNVGYSYDDTGDDKFIDIPCVFLVDGNTASASEILTGAVKDYNIATIIGTQTFGKGIVQDVMPLGDGSGVKITNSKYYTPNGENIHKIGITPDIEVPWDKDLYLEKKIDNQLEAAKNYLTKGTVE